MEYSELLRVALNFATAILLGALIGIEREKRKTEEGEAGGVAGWRTFTLLALFGATAAWLAHSAGSPWILAAAVLCAGAFVVAGYFLAARSNPESTGLTTEVAAVIVFLLGAMVMLGHSGLPSPLASSPRRCSPTLRCTASSPNSTGTMSMPACAS
jgi:uncharacterized membrane protein YhiD involved in acid resistance